MNYIPQDVIAWSTINFLINGRPTNYSSFNFSIMGGLPHYTIYATPLELPLVFTVQTYGSNSIDELLWTLFEVKLEFEYFLNSSSTY